MDGKGYLFSTYDIKFFVNKETIVCIQRTEMIEK